MERRVYCPKCGNAIRTQSHFCSKCGQDLSILEEQKEDESPRATLRKRLIHIKSLSRPLQLLVVITLVQIGLVALLLVTQYIPQPQINSGISINGGENYLVPLVASLVLIASLAAGCWFALAGALQVHWSVRFLIVALATGILAITPVTSLTLNNGTTIEPFATEVWLRWAQLGVLALFWVWALIDSLVAWYKGRHKTMPWHGWTFLGVFGLLLIYYGLEFGIWLAYVRSGKRLTGTSFLLDSLGTQVIFLPFFLVFLALLSSTDLLDWGQIFARKIVATIERRGAVSAERDRSSWPLMALTSLAAVVMLVNVFRQGSGGGFLLGLVVVAILAGAVVLLVRFARIDSHWPKEIPAVTILIGSIYVFVNLVLFPDIVFSLAGSQGLVPQVSNQLPVLLEVPFGLAALTIGLFLLVLGERGKPSLGALGLFLVILALLFLILEVPSALKVIGVSVLQPESILNAMMVCAALGTLVGVSSLFVRRHSSKTFAFEGATQPLAIAFLLLVGLQVVSWANDFYHGITALGSLSPLLLAGFFLVTTLWSFVTSGDQVTNADSPAFPREGRVLLNMGYSLVANALLLYFGTLRAPVTGAPPADYLTGDLTNSSGVVFLGIPLVILGFILSIGVRRVPHAVAATPAPQPAPMASHRRIQVSVIGSGALATVLVIAFIATNTFPQLVHTSTLIAATVYSATVPGPGCNPKDDVEGVGWTSGSSVSTSCLPIGLQVTANPQATGRVIFSPVKLPRNYGVSVQVNFSGFTGCAAIGTRFTANGEYQSTICTDGSWYIDRAGDQPGLLISGVVERATAYILEAVSEGPDQRLSINGIQVGTVSDSVFIGGTPTLELNNPNKVKASAVFHDFNFTPLPVSSPASPSTTYQASTPGTACDKGAAQWALMGLKAATIQCQSNGLRVASQAHGGVLLVFTPPGGVFPQNYRVTVQVLFDNQFVCAAIGTRSVGTNNYVSSLCGDGVWFIERNGQRQHIFLASGLVKPGRTNTIEATVDGSHQRFTINGIQVGSVTDTAFSATGFIGLDTFNAGTVVFSNFIFTPLP